MEKEGFLAAVGSRIRLIRKKQKLTQKEFADKLSVTANTVGRWEDGKNGPDPVAIQAIVDMSDKGFDWFFTGQESPVVDGSGIDGQPIAEDELRMLRLYRVQTPDVKAKTAGMLIDAQLSNIS